MRCAWWSCVVFLACMVGLVALGHKDTVFTFWGLMLTCVIVFTMRMIEEEAKRCEQDT